MCVGAWGVGWGGNRHICEKVSVEIVIELVPVRQIDSDTFRVIDRGHDPRNGIWNYPTGIVKLSVYSSMYSKVDDYKTEKRKKKKKKKTRMLILNTNERNGQLPRLQLSTTADKN